MNLMKIAADYAARHQDRSDFKHSSGYAKAQNREGFGASSVASFEARKAIDESRKFVRGYGSSQIASKLRPGERARVYERPRYGEGADSQGQKETGMASLADRKRQFNAGGQDTKTPGVVLGDARAPQVPRAQTGLPK